MNLQLKDITAMWCVSNHRACFLLRVVKPQIVKSMLNWVQSPLLKWQSLRCQLSGNCRCCFWTSLPWLPRGHNSVACVTSVNWQLASETGKKQANLIPEKTVHRFTHSNSVYPLWRNYHCWVMETASLPVHRLRYTVYIYLYIYIFYPQ